MAKRESDFSFEFSSQPGQRPEAGAPDEAPESGESPAREQPREFRILILADMSGRTNRGIVQPGDIATRKIHGVDVDTLDSVLAKMKPEILLPVSETTAMTLSFQSMNDFRPDSLLERIAAFQGLLALRGQLKDPQTFGEAAAKVRALTGTQARQPKAPETSPGGSGEGSSDFEKLLNQAVVPQAGGPVNVQSMIESIVAGYAVPEADPEQGTLVGLLEDALSAGLRAVLRHPAFQALEAAWRGMEFLASRLNTDDELKLCLMDLSKDELAADFNNAPALEKTAMYHVLVERMEAPGACPFSLVMADYEFARTPEDVGLLARIATLMHAAGSPFVAGAAAQVAGVASFDKFPDAGRWQSPPPADMAQWDTLRSHPHADHIGLAAPRFLLRMPYGPKTDAIDAYPFEEMPGAPLTAGYLWGNGAFAVTLGVGEGFLEDGWTLEPRTDVTDLPCHMAVVDGDKEMTPCAQGWHSDRVGDILHQLGLIPLLSVRNAAAVKVAGVHSIAKGGKKLAASWTQD